MNASNVDSKPKVRKETKNKIKVDFERTSFKERFKAKYLTFTFVKKVVWALIRYILLIGIAYIVLFPFFSKISASVMAPEDFTDSMVRLIPKHFSLDVYKAIFVEQEYMRAFGNTLMLSLSTALIQTFVCSFIAYGFAKFKFKGNKLLFALVILTMIIPHRTLSGAIVNKFANFDFLGIVKLMTGKSFNLLDSYWPFMILSACGLAFKNGLYIFLLRQFFMGVPDELEESAYIDGSGVFRTFFTIILPISIPMMITVFLFAFSWQWTDIFYTGPTMFFRNPNKAPYLLTTDIGFKVPFSQNKLSESANWEPAVKSTGGLMIIAPLVIMYLFCQKYLVQGIERSGLTAD
ncbi:MAG: carbohydrate ABC transporter permease [Ruminococcaceae bacterium]|nr:carbohydrate ABC transporter permease [Oscillospiraceae bacterium]